MKADIFYKTVPGRMFFGILQKTGFFRLAAWFLRTRISKYMISGYVRKNSIDMKPYTGQTYASFAEFFSRKRENTHYVADPHVLISPCDGTLSVYMVTEEMEIPMKGSVYVLNDLIPDKETAKIFKNGLCLVFRLEASDYHHFCCFDDGRLIDTKYVPGQLHSVQPVAQRYVPVYRLNRRWWSIIETKHFGTAVQVEVGAMAVGGVTFFGADGLMKRGEEMGCFELAGSTILLLLNSDVRQCLCLQESLMSSINGKKEMRVKMGSAVGELKYEQSF